MEYVICFGVLLIMLCAVYSVGFTINNFLSINLNSPVLGFISIVALFYIVSAGFMFFCGRFSILFWLFTLFFAVILVVSFYYIYKNNALSDMICKVKVSNNRILCIAAACIIFQVIATVLLVHSDADDSYYVARTSTIICTDMINITEPSTGLEQFAFQNQYAMVGYEVFVAWLCRLSGINAAAMYHTVLAVFLLIIHYFVMYSLGKELFSEKAAVFLLIAILFNTFSGYSDYSQGAFAILRIWQGKAVLVNIILPALLLIFVRMIKDKRVVTKYLAFLYALLLCGMCVSAVGVYITPIAYGLYVCVYLIRNVVFRNIALKVTMYDFIKLCVPVILLLPFVFITFVKLKMDDTIEHVTTGVEGLSYLSVIDQINGKRWIIPVMAIVIIYYLLQRGNYKRFIFGVFPALCFLTILNPVLCKYVAYYITGVPVYWRMFWILQINVCVVSFIIDISERIKINKSIIIVTALFLLICGYPIYTTDNFAKADNIEKIDRNSKYVSDCVLQDAKDDTKVSLLMPELEGYDVRQYNGRIRLLWSRYSESYYSAIGYFDEISSLYRNVYNNRMISRGDYEKISDLKADYVAVYTGTVVDDGIKNSFKKLGDNGYLTLYKSVDVH